MLYGYNDIHPDPVKVQCIQDVETPGDQKEL